MRLIDADALKEALKSNCKPELCHDYNTAWCETCCRTNEFEYLIDDAPTVELDESIIQKVLNKRCMTAVANEYLIALHGNSKRPQGKREFIEILAQNVPEDLCIYPEYKGKPYYSIHYKENGEEFVGFSTYKLEVLSRFLRNYFMEGGAE